MRQVNDTPSNCGDRFKELQTKLNTKFGNDNLSSNSIRAYFSNLAVTNIPPLIINKLM